MQCLPTQHLSRCCMITSIDTAIMASGASSKNNEEFLAAVSDGDEDRVKTLISLGADLNTVNTNLTPLHLAAMNGHCDAVNKLLSHEATVDTKDDWGRTPLHDAAGNGHTNIVTVLLAHRATVDIKCNWRRTPLHSACGKGHIDVVNVLLSHRATVNVKDDWRQTPLHNACAKGHIEIVNVLLSHRATVNAVDKNLQTPLHHCFLNSSHCNVDAVVGLLIFRGADLYQEDKYGNSPVLIGTVLGQEHLLLPHGVSRNTIAKYQLPHGWKAEHTHSKIKYTNAATGNNQYIHPLLQ